MEEEIVSTPVQNPTLMELAINDSKNQQDQNSNNRDRDYPIRSHPVRREQFEISNLRSEGMDFKESHYLRAMPLRVLMLVSTYPSLCCSPDRACSMVCRCW